MKLSYRTSNPVAKANTNKLQVLPNKKWELLKKEQEKLLKEYDKFVRSSNESNT